MSRHDHAWGAKATLQAMFFPKPFLYGVQLILCPQALDGQYLAPSACTAKIVHDLTATPFNITVHAPH